MIESQTDIDFMLSVAGEILSFYNGDIQGIPGFEFTSLVREDGTIYEIEKQNYLFQISTKDQIEKEIEIDNEFTYTDGFYTYTFKVNETPKTDLTGWTLIKVILLSREII